VGGDEIMQNFGKDAFLHFRELQTVMGQEKPTIPSGTWLTFTVTMNQKGQPQARDIQFEPGQQMAALDQSSPAYAASAAVAALGFPQNSQQMVSPNYQTPANYQTPGGGMVPQAYNNPSQQVYVSDAEAYARVQADIEKFQQEVAAQRAKTAVEALGGGAQEVDLCRARERKENTTSARSRSRSRSARRAREENQTHSL